MDSKLISGRSKRAMERFQVRKIFIGAVLLGSLFAFTGTVLGSPLLAISGPNIIMFLYIAWALKRNTDIPNNIIGDSFYYLGFILTLVALTASLISLTDDVVSISKIVGSFGAAMTTTIVGLIARLVVTTFSIEAAERREQLDKEVERSIDKFVTQLDVMTEKVIADMVAMSANIGSSIADVILEFQELSNELTSKNKQVTDNVNSATNALTNRINAIKVDPELVNRVVSESLAGFSTEMSKLSSSYESAVKNVTQVNDKLNETLVNIRSDIVATQEEINKKISSSIERQVNDFDATMSTFSSKIIEELSSFSAIKVESDRAMNDLSEHYKNSIESQNTIIEKINVSLTQLGDQYKKTAEISEQQNAGFEAQAETLRGLDDVTSTLNKALAKTTDELSELDALKARVNTQLSSALTEMLEILSKTNDMADFAGEDMKKVYNELNLQIQQLRA